MACEEPMATVNPGERYPMPSDLFFEQNLGKNMHYHSIRTPFETLLSSSFKGGQTSYSDNLLESNQHDESHSREINNNSERFTQMEFGVMEILSAKDQCTIKDIQKHLDAVTPPKKVEHFMENLERKGHVQRLSSYPLTWAKTRLNHKGSSNSNGLSNFQGSTLFSNRRMDSIYNPAVQTQDLWSQKRGSFSSTTGFNRSISSPAFQKMYHIGHKHPRRKISEPTRTEMSKQYGRQPWRSSVSEDDLNGPFQTLTLHSLDRNSQKQPIIEDLCVSNGSPTILEPNKVPTFGTPFEKYRMTPRVRHQIKRDPGVIGEGRYNPNSRSKSFEETWQSRNQLYPNEYDRHDENMRQRSRSFGYDGDAKSCALCKISFTSKQQSDEHLQSTKHQNKIAKVNAEPYQKFCDYCKVGLNSKSQAQEHFSSGRHEQTVAKSQKAPIRDHPPLNTDIIDCRSIPLTVTKPREYQLELYSKAMNENSVCFLPTGAGMNLISAMVVAQLLQLNPTRQIIFLVDRVLLVLQQSEFLKRELENIQIPLSAKDGVQTNGGLLSSQFQDLRSVRIGAICGEMRKLEPGVPIFSHDILVVTADCYRNHINNGTLRFEDSGLIVLDESHHCNKDHPYNVIIREYYLPDEIPMFDRPKILGLTASPAGESTLDRTVKRIQRLQLNLGRASLLTVVDQIQELTEQTSQVDIFCRYSEYTQSEKHLLGLLMEYATKCFNLAARVSEFKEYKDVFQPCSGGFLSKEDVGPILEVIDKFSIFSKPHTIAVSSLLHFQAICDAISALQECGEKMATDRMLELLYPDCPYGFDWAKDQCLPCEIVMSHLEQRSRALSVCHPIDYMDSGIRELINLLMLKINCEEDDERPLALVLVKRSQTAFRLAKYLDASQLGRTGYKTTCLIGRDAQGSPFGNPTQHSKTITDIRKGHYHIVTATSLSEEGQYLPSFQLVIQLDPPNAVSALARIRAFSCERETAYAAVSRDGLLGKKVKDLLLKERNLIQAAEIIKSGETVCAY